MSQFIGSRFARYLLALSLGLILATLAAFSLTAAPSRISESEKAAYIALAERIPKDAAFTAMAARMDETAKTLNTILKRYQSVDSSFQYDKFVASLKGGLGFNPLVPGELAETGLDAAYGLGAFSLSQDGQPLINMRFSNIVNGQKTLEATLTSLAEGRFAPEQTYKEYRVRLLTQDGQSTGKLKAAYAIKGDQVYLMPEAANLAWFYKHLDAVSALLPGNSLAGEKAFKTLLARLDAGTSFVTYNNYEAYYRELKRGSQRLKESVLGKDAAALSGLDLLDDATAMAEGFTAQIVAVTISPYKIGFLHQLNGPKAKVAEIQKLLRPNTASMFNTLDISTDYIGVFEASFDPLAMRSFLAKRSPAYLREYTKWNATVAEKSHIDFDREIIDNLSGEVAAFYYGMSAMPASLSNAKSLNNTDTMAMAQLVIVAGLKDPAQAKALLERAEKAIRADGQTTKMSTIPSVGEFIELSPNGLPMMLGVHDKWIVLGIGSEAIKAAFDKRGSGPKFDSGAALSLSFKMKAFVRAMNKLKPAADSPNTQLHQLYKVWNEQISSKLNFLDQLTIKSSLAADGFITRGELRF